MTRLLPKVILEKWTFFEWQEKKILWELTLSNFEDFFFQIKMSFGGHSQFRQTIPIFQSRHVCNINMAYGILTDVIYSRSRVSQIKHNF